MNRFSSGGELVTPFDRHLRDVYEGRARDGLAFFEAHGYFDVSETANTVQMFRENVSLNEFWDGREDHDTISYIERTIVYPFGSKSKVPSSRMRSELHRTDSGRFTLLDDDGNPMTEDDLLEMEREDRLKVKSIELDEADMAELEHEMMCVKEAIEVIRVEKYRFQRVFYRAFYMEDDKKASIGLNERQNAPENVGIPQLSPSIELVDLPPYSGNLFVLRETMVLLRRSWCKRWCTLDFRESLMKMFKRSYWQRPRGDIDLRSVTKVEMTGQCGFRIEFRIGNMILMRAKNEKEATHWVQRLHFVMQLMRIRRPEVLQLTNS
ncbi:hypothetical protein F443_03119 [Plasmopara halstedii]|uniref:PH domain-containing protein n=1 Tax=Plasmopara halstedii TaxID=4781 RepID=A0A0P1B429_PLAHL|nr:hypothetical protein F443_03119 [Plasmopara halstedii]CEG49530.1 hypothetical protein F443_03119 [Plasmopara halstedii]|eukprot:XP_024585899.1 hypothetical protein F443_03119 [Plasmopara halstedii]